MCYLVAYNKMVGLLYPKLQSRMIGSYLEVMQWHPRAPALLPPEIC